MCVQSSIWPIQQSGLTILDRSNSISFELDLVVAAGVVKFDIDQVHVGGFF